MDTVPTEARERIAHAITVLREFADEDITRDEVEVLLSMWRDRRTLTSRQREEVLAAFPAGAR